MITTLHFISPYWFLALLPLGYIWWRLKNIFSNSHQWHKVCDPHLLSYLSLNNKQGYTHLPKILLGLIWLLGIIALAGPAWKQLPVTIYKSQQSRIIILDLSPNLQANDLQPNRLLRSRYKLLDLLNQYKTGQTGLIVYSGEPYVVTPLTEDVNTIKNMVPYLSPKIMPVTGSDLTAALNLSEKLLKNSHVMNADIIVLTASEVDKDAINKAKSLQHEGYKVSVLGLGSLNKVPLMREDGSYLRDNNNDIIFSQIDNNMLAALAKAGGGRYVLFTNNQDDINFLMQYDHPIALKKYSTHVLTERWQDEGWWLIWPILILTLGIFIYRLWGQE